MRAPSQAPSQARAGCACCRALGGHWVDAARRCAALRCAALSVRGAQVAFYMRKGADILSKWVGESERQLRALFEEAQRLQPSIIFFDEIDGLAPVRSSRSDQARPSLFIETRVPSLSS